MGCGCGKKKVYVVTTKAGVRKEVPTLTAAMAVVRAEGGHYQLQRG